MKLYQNKAYVYFILKGREVHDYIRRNLVVLCWSYWYVHVYWHIQYGVSIKHIMMMHFLNVQSMFTQSIPIDISVLFLKEILQIYTHVNVYTCIYVPLKL